MDLTQAELTVLSLILLVLLMHAFQRDGYEQRINKCVRKWLDISIDERPARYINKATNKTNLAVGTVGCPNISTDGGHQFAYATTMQNAFSFNHYDNIDMLRVAHELTYFYVFRHVENALQCLTLPQLEGSWMKEDKLL